MFNCVPCTLYMGCKVDMCLFIYMCAQCLPSLLFLDLIFSNSYVTYLYDLSVHIAIFTGM